MSKYNFYAGPAILPQEALDQAKQAVIDFDNMGLSILEISHRSKNFVAVMDRAEALVRELYNVNDEYAILFLSGGASTQFFMAPMNLLNENETAGYLDTGTWASKAIKEAKAFGNIDVLASSKEENYCYYPKDYAVPNNLKYLHLTSNNTIYGTQLHVWPDTDVPLVCDMSSDIFSCEIPLEKFDLIYAGAQKNMGPAGVTLVIVKRGILDKVDRYIPTILRYSTHDEKKSMYNTPPVFPIYVSMLTMEWILKNGGVNDMYERNKAKANLLYNEIDRNTLFYNNINREDRSLMNVTFHMHNEGQLADFISFAEKRNCIGLKGHRSVGGLRASIYNAMSVEGVQALVDTMAEFEKQNA